MNKPYYENEDFKGKDFAQSFDYGEYESCSFSKCNFSGLDLRDVNFIECKFDHCDFSNAQLQNTGFQDVHFSNCKLMGLRFDKCDPFLLTFSFESCQLDFSSFYALKIQKTLFKDCRLQEVEFVETDLTASSFQDCDLQLAVFDRAELAKVDFRTAENFSIDPERNHVKKAKFSLTNVQGLLEKYDISIK